MKTSIPALPAGDVLVYKYGCRVDPDCLPLVNEQITLARRMYNDLIADMRQAVDARSQRTLDLAGAPAIALRAQIETLNQAFAAARAANDEDAMKTVAQERRGGHRLDDEITCFNSHRTGFVRATLEVLVVGHALVSTAIARASYERLDNLGVPEVTF